MRGVRGVRGVRGEREGGQIEWGSKTVVDSWWLYKTRGGGMGESKGKMTERGWVE